MMMMMTTIEWRFYLAGDLFFFFRVVFGLILVCCLLMMGEDRHLQLRISLCRSSIYISLLHAILGVRNIAKE